MSDRLLASVRQLLDVAEPILDGRASIRLADVRSRLEGPLRVALAGKVKAGKSTLLNALVGEKVAPTDASECTRVVTWYRNSYVYRATAVPFEGEPTELRLHRTENAIEISLGDRTADELQYLDVEWPSSRLEDVVLIDTPGLASVSTDVSMRTQRFLSSDEEGPGDADAVVYLMRHLHPTDLSFLEAFKDEIATRGATVNSIAVLSRADEIGSCRTNAMNVAGRIAERYRHDARIRTLCQIVVPVAGLIAEAAATLREDEAAALRAIAGLDRSESTDLLLSAERFLTRDASAGLDPAMRQRLLARLGLFGVRLAIELLIANRVSSTGDLSRELESRSGIVQLRQVLAGQFASRAIVLKARSTLATVWALADLHGGSDGRMLKDRVRDIERGAHELVEIRLLQQLRVGALSFGPEEEEARRVLGDHGPQPALRLALSPTSPPEEVRAVAIDTISRWRLIAADPLSSKEARDIAEGVIRSCEAMAMVDS